MTTMVGNVNLDGTTTSTMYANASGSTPSYTHVSISRVIKVHPLGKTSTFFSNNNLNAHTRGNQYLSLMYIIYTNTSNKFLCTLTLICIRYEESTLPSSPSHDDSNPHSFSSKDPFNHASLLMLRERMLISISNFS